VDQHSRAFIGIDTSKLRNAVAVAEEGRDGEVRYLGEIDTTEAATRKLVIKLAAKYRQLTFCYEAGPTGYGLHRLIGKLGHDCIVAAPSLIPKKPGDRVKTNRRDAVGLAKLLRAGELTTIWVPDERHEAMRDLSRAREAARKDLKGKRQQVSSFMLRLGRHYPGKKTWGPAHMNWLMLQKLEHREQRIVLEELLGAVRQESERVERLEQAIRDAVPEWSCRGRHSLAGDAGDRSRCGSDGAGRDRRSVALSTPPRVDGVPRSRTLRKLHRRHGQPRRYHQGWQWSGAAYPGRSCLELSVSSTC
jgi:transposase